MAMDLVHALLVETSLSIELKRIALKAHLTQRVISRTRPISHHDIPHLFHVLSFLYFADPAKKTLLLCPKDNGTSHAYLSSFEVHPLLIAFPTEGRERQIKLIHTK